METKTKIKILVVILAIAIVAGAIYGIWFLLNPKYTVTFDLNGGEMEETEMKIRYGESYDLPIPTKKDMVFAGWLLNGQYFDSKGNDWPLKKDTTLVASWEYRDESGVVYEPNENGYSVIDYKGYAYSSIFVPNTYLGKPVTEIKDGAFVKLKAFLDTIDTEVATLYFPSGIIYNDDIVSFDERVHIVEYSYMTSEKLVILENEDSISIVGYQGRYNQTTIIIPTSINGKPVTEIGAFAFYEASRDIDQSSSSFTTRLLIPESIIKVGKSAFGKCGGMKVSLYQPHETDGFREIITLERLYNWKESVVVEEGNDHFVDVVTLIRPAIGWSHFTHASCFVKLDANGGVVYNENGIKIDSVFFKMNSKTYSLPVPTRTGYVFDGWYYGEEKVTLTGGAWPYKEHIKLTAQWSKE